MGKKVLATMIAVGVMMPSMAFAQTSTTTNAIQALLQQIAALQAQLIALQQQKQVAVFNLLVTLKQGDSGENVKMLQQILAQDPSLYPEGLITGFFGPKTAKAIMRFQARHGFEQVGNVGPKTLKKLNELFGGKGKSENSGPGKGKDKDDDDHDEDKDGFKDSASTTPGVGKVTLCHKGKNTIFVGLPAVGAHIAHGDTVGACAGGGTGTTTPPTADTVAPVISGIVANGISMTGATINWNTNEAATGQVEYGLTDSYGTFTSLVSTLSTGHSIPLTGLTASTTYHFRVWSKDAANNMASSSDQTFTTGQPDAPPVISSVSVTGIGADTATVSWNTNESADGKVYFATTTPVNFATAQTMFNPSLSTSHLFTLTSLTASSTYYYVVTSKDTANNTATSSESSFVTL